MKKKIGFALNVLALALFIPGIILPMFTLNMELKAGVGTTEINSPMIDKDLSVINTVEELWLSDKYLVAVLILLFSIGIPVVKSILVSWAFFVKNTDLQKKVLGYVSVIGKWSMADVFVVAIFLAVLSTNHSATQTDQQISMFGFNLKLIISSETLSSVLHGFYFFVGYCLISMVGTQLMYSAVNFRGNPSMKEG